MVLKRVLIVDDEENILTSLKGVLEDEKFVVETAGDGATALERIPLFNPDVALLDIWMPGEDGLRLLERVRRHFPGLQVIMMSGHGTVENAVRAIKMGAFDFLEKPIQFEKLLVLLEHVFAMKDLQEENRSLKEALETEDQIIGESTAIDRLRKLIYVVAPSNGWILIQGENGTGKELVARMLHYASPRSKSRFIAVNCAAIPDELIESELFGHEKGAFTGAYDRKIGKFELAHGGTLFLDEIGDMGLKMQAKILRALQECCIQRVGGDVSIEINLRVIAATNKDLKKQMLEGEFREDLFYRLNVIPLRVPTLRERIQDIPLLCSHFIKRFSGTKYQKFTDRALRRMMDYTWPGNVRELKNWVERACILTQKNEIDVSEVETLFVPHSIGITEEVSKSLREARAAFEKQYILKMLSENGNNISKTAQTIGLERSHLHKKLKTFGIEI
jgi:two-component system nitrogen regulation response regulator NtrX